MDVDQVHCVVRVIKTSFEYESCKIFVQKQFRGHSYLNLIQTEQNYKVLDLWCFSYLVIYG